MMTLTQPSQAEIVYTPTHKTVRGTLALDLNNDGVTDFTITSYLFSTGGRLRLVYQGLYVAPNDLNGVWVAGSDARALPAGEKVKPGDTFGRYYGKMERCKATRTSFYSSGGWLQASNQYLGLAFSIGGRTHYGWARLSVSLKGRCKGVVAVLTGYAYETVPDKPILTGKISGADEMGAAERPETTLGTLALGSVGLVAWRRDEDAGAQTR
jgi:hypothetical protein